MKEFRLGGKKDIGHNRNHTVNLVRFLTELLETFASKEHEIVASCHWIPVGHHATRLKQESISAVKQL